MRALSDTTTSDLVETAADLSLSDISGDVHPYRTWIWFGVFAAGAGFWFAVGLGIHALMH
jgi:hypothetical protein